jgi:hypothetical protein
MSELEVQRTIAETPAQRPATGQSGPVIGASNATAIMKALKDNGYVIMPRHKATEFVRLAGDIIEIMQGAGLYKTPKDR